MSEPWPRLLLLVAPALVVLAALGARPRRSVAGRAVALFRCLLPSWQFFDQVESVPALHYRTAPSGDDWSEWHDALPVPARTAGSLWLNAAGNLHLACRSLVEHLVAELEELAARQLETDRRGSADGDGLARAQRELVSYRLLCALIEQRARATLPSSPRLRYQFRLLEAEPGEAPFLSGVHGVE